MKIDLGKKNEVCCGESPDEAKVYYPSIHIEGVNHEKFPKGLFDSVVKLELVAYDKRRGSATLEVKSVSFNAKKKKKKSLADSFDESADAKIS